MCDYVTHVHVFRRGNHLLTPQELMDMYDQVERGGDLASRLGSQSSGSDDEIVDGLGRDEDRHDDDESSGLLGGPDSTGSGKPMRRYIAITVVEIVFVLAEYAFWQVTL
jgi:hypothetical protein